MGFKPGHKKSGGRKKGTPNKKTQALQEKADALGIDPFEILLLYAAGRWKKLGYKARTIKRYTPTGSSYEEDVISPDLRAKCAGDACQYLHAKRKAIEVEDSGDDQEPMTFRIQWADEGEDEGSDTPDAETHSAAKTDQ